MINRIIFENGFGGFGGVGNVEIFDVEIQHEGRVQSDQIQVPLIMAQAQFTALVQQAAQVKIPCKVKISQPYDVWDTFDKKHRRVERSLEFWNFAWDNNKKEERV